MSVTVRRVDHPSLLSLEIDELTDSKTAKAAEGVSHSALHLKANVKSSTVDGVHRREISAKLLRSRGSTDSLSWLDEELEMLLKVSRDGRDMKSSEILHHGARDNNLSSNIPAVSRFPDMILALMNYAQCFAVENWPRPQGRLPGGPG